jgi:hypothetical protein
MHQNIFERVKIRVAESLAPFCAAMPKIVPRRKKDMEPGGRGTSLNCVFSQTGPASSVDQGNIKICKYLVLGDAVSTDYVTNEGGPAAGDISLAPIFFGNAWNTANPSIGDVMNSVNRIINSPIFCGPF